MQKTIRKISNASGRKVIGLFYSQKMQTHIQFESVLEQNFFYLLECDRTVKAFRSQPLTIEYFFNDKLRHYTPDVEVYYFNQERLKYIEIKPEQVAKYPEFIEKTQFIGLAFKELGADFEVITSEAINCQPKLNNSKLLCTYSAIPVPREIYLLCQEAFRLHAKLQFESLARHISKNNSSFSLFHIYALIFRGEISFNAACILGEKSELTWGGSVL